MIQNVINKVKNIDSKDLKYKLTNLADFCTRQYMMAPRMKGFLSLVEELCEKVHSYLHYLNKQTERNETVRFAQGPPEPNLEEFSSIQLKRKNSEIEADLETFRKLDCWTKCIYSPGGLK